MNPYLPKLAKVINIIQETPDVKTIRLKLLNEEKLVFKPGNFVMISCFGIGESSFAISSSPFIQEYFEVSVRAVGNVTRAIHKLKVGDVVGVRGPLGNGYPITDLLNKNIVIISGGTGILGVSSLLWYIHEKRDDFGEVLLFYGARTPKDLVRYRDIKTWGKNIKTYVTVDRADETWKGPTGVVTKFLDEVTIPKHNVIFIMCGPPIMMKVTYRKLIGMGYKAKQIYASLERRMQCGLGKCGCCMLSNGLFVCKDGPIFRCDMLMERDIE